MNPNAIQLLENNIEYINWAELSLNPNAINLLERYYYKIIWHLFSNNINSVSILKDYPKKINWTSFISKNINIFEIDYEILKKRIEIFKEELIQKCFHPNKVFYYLDVYQYDIANDEYVTY